jgi:hypothetical protein
MDRELQRKLVLQWGETGRFLEELRRSELRAMSDEKGREISEMLLSLAESFPLSQRRRTWSGLVEQQALFHRRRVG